MFRGEDLPGLMPVVVLALVGLTFGLWKIVELIWYVLTHLQWVG